MPDIVPRHYTRWPEANEIHRHSKLTPEAEEILKKWGWVDEELYQAARKIYLEKDAEARKCLGIQ